MPLINVTRKTVTVQAYQLTSQAEMVAALDYLSNGNYAGMIQLSKNGQGQKIWTMILQNLAGSTQQQGAINDWVVIENSAIATIRTPTEFAAMYQAA